MLVCMYATLRKVCPYMNIRFYNAKILTLDENENFASFTDSNETKIEYDKLYVNNFLSFIYLI